MRRTLRPPTRRISQALLSALALALLSVALLRSQSVDAAARTTYYGISVGSTAASAQIDTPTDTPTDTATPTPTDTPTATPTNTPTPVPTATATPSGPPPHVLDVSAAATQAGWPQQFSNWCGIATVALIADYINPGSPVSQSAIVSMLNNPANQSIWSYPPPSSSYWGPYVPTNISGDFGTDPRSLAEGLTLATGRLYHAKVDTSGAWDTTVHIVHDLLVSRQPISVFVDHGQHSVIVSGVEATGDPLTNPKSITAIHVWDPGGGVNHVGIQAQIHVVVPIATWLSGVIAWSGSDYFKFPYAANVYQGKALDPDPAVGPYAYQTSGYNHLWVGQYVYLSPLASGETANLSSDWELNQYGTLIAGLPGGTWPNLPDGYTGSSVPMPTNPPPPPPPVQPPKPAPKLPPPPPPRPTPTARPTLTATPLATATALPTSVPTAISKPTACAPISCALAALGNDSGLLLGSLLLLLLALIGFPAAIIVARMRVRLAAQTELAEQDTLLTTPPDVDAVTLSDALETTPTLPDMPAVEPGSAEIVPQALSVAPTDATTDAPSERASDAADSLGSATEADVPVD